MLSMALTFLIVGLVAGLLGLWGVAQVATQIAWILFLVGIVLLVFHMARTPAVAAGRLTRRGTGHEGKPPGGDRHVARVRAGVRHAGRGADRTAGSARVEAGGAGKAPATAQTEVSGKIKSVDPAGRTVLLEDGTRLMIPGSVNVDPGRAEGRRDREGERRGEGRSEGRDRDPGQLRR